MPIVTNLIARFTLAALPFVSVRSDHSAPRAFLTVCRPVVPLITSPAAAHTQATIPFMGTQQTLKGHPFLLIFLGLNYN